MGLLDDILRGALGGAGGGLGGGLGRQHAPTQQGGSNMSAIVMALLPVVLGMLANRGNAPQAGFGQGQGQGGGGLGDLIGGILGGGATAGGGAGGLGDLLERFQRAGFGEQAQSWVGTGQNLPIPADIIGQIFGSGGLSQIAQQAGLSEHEASEGLSQLLPEVVDRVTPGGQVPDLDQLSASVEALARQFRG